MKKRGKMETKVDHFMVISKQWNLIYRKKSASHQKISMFKESLLSQLNPLLEWALQYKNHMGRFSQSYEFWENLKKIQHFNNMERIW